MNADRNSQKYPVMDVNGTYFDWEWNEISKWAYINIRNYNTTYRKFQNALTYNDYDKQYKLIEKLNWLAHRIAKQLWNDRIEMETYEIKNDFARREIKRRWKSIIRYDAKEKRYYLTRLDWSDSIHVGNEIEEDLK